MNVPDAARDEFESLVTGRLERTTTHKKQVRAALADATGDAQRVLTGVLAQLDRLERKTSPLYVRLVHALASYAVLPDRDWSLTAELHDAVAHSTKRFELMFEPS